MKGKIKLKYIGIFFGIFLLVISTTFAWFVWSSNNNTNMKVSVGSFADVSFIKGENISISNLAPTLYYDDGVESSFKIRKKNGVTDELVTFIYLDITSISSELQIDSFKYILLSSSDNNNYNVVTEGNFGDVTTGRLDLVSTSALANNSTYYKLYIWLDGNSEQNVNVQNKSFVASVHAEVKFEPSFANDSWDTIANNLSTNSDTYSVGDTKCVALDGFTTTNDNGCSNGEFLVRVANTSTPSGCSGNSQTACGFVVEFVDIIEEDNMNSGVPSICTEYLDQYVMNTLDLADPANYDIYNELQNQCMDRCYNFGSWPNTNMKNYVMNEIYDALPTELKNVISTTTSISSGDECSSIPKPDDWTSYDDKLYLLSLIEVVGPNSDALGDNIYSRQLDYYSAQGVTSNNLTGVSKQFNGSETAWWLRTAIYETSFYIMEEGHFNSALANDSYLGVSPAFRIES